MVKTKPIKYRTPPKKYPFWNEYYGKSTRFIAILAKTDRVFVKVFQSMYTASSYDNFFYDFFSAKLRPIKYSPMGVLSTK